MFKGTAYALTACFIWGLIFIIPQFMSSFTPLEIALCRYCFFGGTSLFFLLKARMKGLCSYPLSVWIKAIYLSIFSGYYLWVVLAIRYTSPAICALILGISPITIAFYGNWSQKEGNFTLLIFPSLLILAGLILINAPHITITNLSSDYIIGLLCCLISLFCWTVFVVLNSRFLKNNLNIVSTDWATIQGVAILFWVLIIGIGCSFYFWNELDLQKYFVWNEETISFYLGCATLGSLCSWVGALLWNKASIHLPVSLAGQLLIFETIFGIMFAYLLEQQLPPLMECAGIILLLAAVVYGIRVINQVESYPQLQTSSIDEKALHSECFNRDLI